MSGYSSGDGNLESLLAQLRSGQQSQQKPQVNLQPSATYGYSSPSPGYFGQPEHTSYPPSYHPPTVASAVPTPSGYNTQPHHSSAIMSPAETPRIPTASGDPQNAARTSSLLNLLKFQPATNSSRQQPAPIGTPLPPSREPSMGYGPAEAIGHIGSPQQGRGGSDLLSTLMSSVKSQQGQQPSPQLSAASPPAQSSFSARSEPPVEAQNYLLSLLNKPKPPQTDSTPQLTPSKVLTPPSKSSSQGEYNETAQTRFENASLDLSLTATTALEGRKASAGKENIPETAPKPQGIFTYVNPFDQLAASSPRIRTPKASTPAPAAPTVQILKRQGDNTDQKHKIDEQSSVSSHTHTSRKLQSPSQVSSGPPTPLPDGRSKLEALIGIGASKETVAEALEEVGSQADKQVQEALARTDKTLDEKDETGSRAEQEDDQATMEKNLQEMLAAQTEQEFEESAQIAAQSIKRELEKEENRHALDAYPVSVAEAVKEIIDDAANGDLGETAQDAAQRDAPDSWESADADETTAKEPEEKAVKVCNFPMRPWISISIQEGEDTRPLFRDDATMDIARLKKEFDQVDRVLVTASNNFIVYGMSKNGGIRAIRQDDGKDGKLFTETRDRIFTVVICASSADLKESIIGTGISGTVYWALVKDGEGDHLDEDHRDHLEMHGFALTPIQSMDNESPGGVLKTRARKSSNHPDFFAIGRGKFVHIIWPNVIMKSYIKNGKDRAVDTEKYLAQHTLKVNTGKAGKDFSFSEDDTTIVSLDKAGRVKFWDIRPLTKSDGRGNPFSATSSIEIKEPLMTLITTPGYEKSWPTSVLLVDKIRPYQRGGPLRYLIVGMKQNHSLQLWDLALGKPVQEIHLPHGKESDAVCSVLYHAQTGMIVVGHPTRNSIYFLHLSAPKYILSKSMTQAEFVHALATKSVQIATPESTAVISGMREYSFENKGSLRSLDILQTPNSSSTGEGPPTMFELYAMHSKGVTCLAIKQSDLGWTPENKVISGIDAEKEGVIFIDSLKEIPVTPTPVPESTESTPQVPLPVRSAPRSSPEKASSKESKKVHHAESANASASKSESRTEKKDASSSGATPASEKLGKGKRRKAASAIETPPALSASPSKPIVLDPMSNSRNGSSSKLNNATTPEVIPSVPSTSQAFNEASVADIGARVAEDVKKAFDASLGIFTQDIKSDRKIQTAVAEGHQEAMLRMVSATLADNIEVTLTRIVETSIQAAVVPAISEITSKIVTAQLNEHLGPKLNSNIATAIPKELQRVLPDAIGRAVQQPQLLKLMAESLAKSVAFGVQDHFATIMQNSVTPAFTKLAIDTSKEVAADVQRQAAEQIAVIEQQRSADSVKIDHLSRLIGGLTETISTMAAAQQEFQERTLQQISRENTRRTHSTAGSAGALAKEKSEAQRKYEAEFEEIGTLMEQGDFEAATLIVLQNPRSQEMFVDFAVRFDPSFLQQVNTIVLLSLGNLTSDGIDDAHMSRRIEYLDMILRVLNGQINDGSLVRHM
ncbi:hypothetical protein B0O99DRAFT_516018 [Bisporella sp. PMI_857]|nr:hypothetical protein B0O99DRAFT_516018 [Bisporella sp. PMI_857]